MKQKRSHLAALLLAAVMLMTFTAYAAPNSPERPGTPENPQNPGEVTIVDDDVPLVEVPSVEVKPEVTVSNDTATVAVGGSELKAALEAVVNGEAARITVNAVADTAGTGTVAAVLPTEALKEVAAQGSAEVQVATSAGAVTLPSTALASIVEAAGGNDVSVSMSARSAAEGQALLSGKADVDAARIEGGSVTEISITSGGESIVEWNGSSATVYLPVGSAAYEENQTYTVYQADANGNVVAHTGVCVMVNGELRIVLSVDSLGTFVVLAGSTGVSMAADPSVVPAPLFQV